VWLFNKKESVNCQSNLVNKGSAPGIFIISHSKWKRKKPFNFSEKKDWNRYLEKSFDFPLMETNKPVSYDKLTQSKEWTDLFSGKKMNLLKESILTVISSLTRSSWQSSINWKCR